jgi:hypothetical protein
MTEDSDPDADGLVAEAERVAEDDPDRAAELAQRALDANPESAGAANVLGVIAYARGRLVDAQSLFAQACAQPDADEDMRLNLAAVRSELAPVTTAFAQEALGYTPSSTRLGQALASGRDPAAVARMAEIPSATTPGERNFIRQFTCELWNGRDDVFENGPLLGGTTRALALGMVAHSGRVESARLHTYDWFNAGVELDVPPEAFDALIQRGLLDPAARAEMERTKSFKPVFDDVHAGHDYSPLVVSHTGALPGSPEDEDTMSDLYVPEPGRTWDLLLADGLKSWYGTRYWMQHTADAIPAGSHLLFQDYAWYSCFWLSALIGLFADRFELVAHIDTTYAFRLTRAIEPSEVLDVYPPAPHDLGTDGIDELWRHLAEQSEPMAGTLLPVALTIHHAGALAYVGDTERARSIIDGLLARPESGPWRQNVENARLSPTYSPAGPIEL